MPLNRAEFQIRKRLPRRSSILLFDAACLLGWTSVAQIAELAGVSLRRARLELAELVEQRWLSLEERGPRNQDREVRYAARVGVIARDPSAVIRNDHTGAIADDPRGVIAGDPTGGIADDPSTPYRTRARAPAPPDPDLPLDQKGPSVREGSGEGHARTGGRSGDVRNRDVQWIREQWSVSGTIAHSCWRRLLELGASREEAREYLGAARRGTHAAFQGLEHATYKLGAACTRERFEPWIEWYRRSPPPAPPAPRPPRDTDERARNRAAAARELGERAAAAQRALASDEPAAIGALVAKEIRRRG